MANTFNRLLALTPVSITEIKGQIVATVLNGQTLTIVSGGAPDLAIVEIFDPDVGKKIEVTINITAREVAG